MASAESRGAIDWLAAASPDPESCRWQWERGPTRVALLPAGVRWDVVAVPTHLGRIALDLLFGASAGTGPGAVLLPGPAQHGASPDPSPGPVLTGARRKRVGFFVPVGTADTWVGTDTRCLGRGGWIPVPHPTRPLPPSEAVHAPAWLVAPDGSGQLNDPILLDLVLHEAAARVAEIRASGVRDFGGGA